MSKFTFIVCCVLSFVATSFSQSKKILPPGGNNVFISDIEFNAESTRIISVGFDGKIVVWDIASKKPIKTINQHKGPIWSVNLNEAGTRFITASEDSTIKIWDARSFELIKSMHLGAPIYYAEYDRMDHYIITSSPTGKVVILDAATNELFKEYQIESDFLNQAILSTNSKLFFTGDNAGNFKAIGVEDGKEYLNHNMETAIKSMKFSKDKSILVLHLLSGRAEMLAMPNLNGIGALYAPVTSITPTINIVSQIDISADSKWIVSGQDSGHIDMIRTETMIKQAVLSSHDFITKCLFSRNGRYAAALGKDFKITILDLLDYGDPESRRVPFKLLKQESDIPKWLQFHPDSTIAFTGYYSNHWDLKTGLFTNIPAFEENYEDFIFQSEQIQEKDHVFYYDIKSMLFLIKDDTALYRPYNLKLSPNEKYIAYQRNNQLYHFDLDNKKLIAKYPNNREIFSLDNAGIYVISGDPKGVNINGKSIELPWNANDADIYENKLALGTLENEFWIYDIPTKKIKRNPVKLGAAAAIRFINQGKNVAIAGYTKELQVLNASTGALLYKTNVEQSITSEISVSQDGQSIALNADDRIIRIFNNDVAKLKLEKAFEIYTLKDHGAIAVNNEGYYISGNSAHKSLAFFYNDKVYPGSYFDLEFNRPDLVLENSPYSKPETIAFYKEIVESRKQKTGDLYAMELPFIEFINKSEYSVSHETNTLELKCILPPDLKVENLAFFNNNVPIQPKIKQKGTEVSIFFNLIPGKNRLEVCPQKENNFGLKDYYEITYDIQEKPDLYFVCLGVSNYDDASFNLKYAAKDAGDFYNELASSSEFKTIYKKLYIDQEVSKEKLAEIKLFLAKAAQKDVVIVFIAGHGVLDADYQYYFATHDIDFNNPKEKGISFYDLEDMLSNIAAINKVLFMDTCHSGELDESEIVANEETIGDGDITFRGSTSIKYSKEYQNKATYMNALFSDLRTNNGAVILSSSGGVEFSMEGEKWKNGLFTYCLLKGLRENKGDLDRDGEIQINELLSYVSNQVYFLSKGRQKPNLRQSNLSLDLRLK